MWISKPQRGAKKLARGASRGSAHMFRTSPERGGRPLCRPFRGWSRIDCRVPRLTPWARFSSPLRGFSNRRGSALLTVLWVSAALAAVSFSLSQTVRGEAERVSTDLDGLRAYYLAAGAV